MTPLLIQLSEQLADLFDDQHISYAFGGALANNVWGIIRATQDADCLISVPQLQFQEFADGLNSMGCVIRDDGQELEVTVEALRGQIDQRNMMDVFWQGLSAELFVPIVPLQSEILRRAVAVKLESRDLKFMTAEDLILLKLVFHRPKDILDVRGILYAQREKLDYDYLSQWAATTLDDAASNELDDLIAEYASDNTDSAD